jgi:transcriptional regulator with XRE-family HTH domain
MLDSKRAEQRVSTGLTELDQVLEGLYWGDNVVWQLDAAPVGLFYSAIGELAEAFDARTYVSVGTEVPALADAGVGVIDAGAGTRFANPAELLREIHHLCQPGELRLLLFDSLDSMVETRGASSTRGFLGRCCPMLLDLGAIAYWSMCTHRTPAAVRDTVAAVTECVLRVDDRSVRVTKAEARSHGVRRSVLHWHEENGRVILAAASINGRVAASLRAIRRARGMSQHELAKLGGVTASAISQAERAERGLSLSTLAQLSVALGITIDDLLHGEGPDPYRIGRRPDDRQNGDGGHIATLLGGADSDLVVELVHLSPRQSARPVKPGAGTGIVAVANGLVHVRVSGQTPALRSGEVLVSAAERIEGWRNIGQSEAMLFWIVEPASPRPAFRRR